jgi:hypothetical protein
MTKIFIYAGANPLGNFVNQIILATSIKERILNSNVCILYDDNRPYKSALVKCAYNADLIIRNYEKQTFPIQFFSYNEIKKKNIKISDWKNLGFRESDIVISGNSIDKNFFNKDMNIVNLVPPKEMCRTNDKKLEELGLNLNKWYAAVYWKEPGYLFRPENKIRTYFDCTNFLKSINYIVNDLGGQVVRLGHPGKSYFDNKNKNIIDLANIPNSEELQMYSISRSRFLVSTASGPTQVGMSFGTPTLMVDSPTITYAFGEENYILTYGIKVKKINKEFKQLEAYKKGLLDDDCYNSLIVPEIVSKEKKIPEIEYRKNTLEEIIEGINEMYLMTKKNKSSLLINKKIKIKKFKENKKLEFPLSGKTFPQLLIPPSKRKKSS